MAQGGAVVINMTPAETTSKKESKQLFGPDIGIVNDTPAWAHAVGKSAAADSLSADIIKSWIAKSKEPTQPTTTLQALVNLKRPTLRLVPLTLAPGDDPDQADSHHHHGLEFEYDCDAPKCRIDVNVILPADHPLAENVDAQGFSFSRVLVFQSVVDGGFAKFLKLEEDATLELGRFEQAAAPVDVASEKPAADAQPTGPAVVTPQNTQQRKRFAAFRFRKRTGDRAPSGPALAVVDADVASPVESEKEKGFKDDTREGVRATIRLSALDEDGMDVATVNEQTTYLHIIRVGTPPTAGEEDTRPWVVKVVKREATIGPHTFHLHEIYGLTAQSSAPTQPPVSTPTPTDAHTYPPTATAASATAHEDEPSSECLLCLSSPREVILLPCRHLVACKECAVNMVEFGAGGQIVHSADTNPTALAGTDVAIAEGGSGAANASSTTGGTNPPLVSPSNPRRKRKAKGWFCPVCRQPYTSLLRISTTPLTKDISDDEHRRSASLDEPDNEQDGADATGVAGASEVAPENDNDALATPGGVMNSLRSGLRNLALGDAPRESDTLPRDVERGLVAGSEASAT